MSAIGEAALDLFGSKQFDVFMKRALIALQGQNVVGLSVDDFPGNLPLAAHGVDRHHRAFDRKHIDQCGDGCDFVGFLRDLHLPQYQLLPRRECAQHMQGILVAFRAGAARSLAINGDDLSRLAGHSGHKAGKTRLERLNVKACENDAQLIFTRRSIGKPAEPAKKFQPLLAKPGNLADAIAVAEHCNKAKKQNFFKRITHFQCLPLVRKFREIRKKNNPFGNNRLQIHAFNLIDESEASHRFTVFT